MLRLLTRSSRSLLFSPALRQRPSITGQPRFQSSGPGNSRDLPAREALKDTASRNKLKVDHSRFVAEAHQNDDWPEGSQKQEGNITPDEKRVQSTRRGRLLPTDSHLFKLVLPLPGLKQPPQFARPKDGQPPPPTVFLLHPSQPLSHVSSLIQSALPSPTQGPQPYTPRLPLVSFQNTAVDEPDALPDEPKHQWSDSTDIGDFVKEAAHTQEFTIVITPDQRLHTAQLAPADNPDAKHKQNEKDAYEPLEIPVSVPSFDDRTRYLRRRLERLQGELSGLQEIKDSCDALARRGTKRMATGVFAILITWWLAVLRLTFFTELGWDVMEPVTYLTDFIVIMAGYAWFLRQGREVSYSSILNQSLSIRRRRLYESKGLDIERWAEIVIETKAINKEIEKIREDYEGGWKESGGKPKEGSKPDKSASAATGEAEVGGLDKLLLSGSETAAKEAGVKEGEAVQSKREQIVGEDAKKTKDDSLLAP